MKNKDFQKVICWNDQATNANTERAATQATRELVNRGHEDFSFDAMTALSFQMVSASQNPQKQLDSAIELLPNEIYASYDTDLKRKNSFNNHSLDSAVFFSTRDFKRQSKDYLH